MKRRKQIPFRKKWKHHDPNPLMTRDQYKEVIYRYFEAQQELLELRQEVGRLRYFVGECWEEFPAVIDEVLKDLGKHRNKHKISKQIRE